MRVPAEETTRTRIHKPIAPKLAPTAQVIPLLPQIPKDLAPCTLLLRRGVRPHASLARSVERLVCMRARLVPRERLRRRRHRYRVNCRVGLRLRGRGRGGGGILDHHLRSCSLCELPLSSSLALSTLLLRSGLRRSVGDGSSVFAFAPHCFADLLGDAALALCVPGFELCGSGRVVRCWVVHDRCEFWNACRGTGER